MKQQMCSLLLMAAVFAACSNEKKGSATTETQTSSLAMSSVQESTSEYGEFKTQVELGEHLVTIMDCDACHSPKKMTDRGPVIDESLRLSGHPANMPLLKANEQEIAKQGYAVTNETQWIGPWGTSFTANLTPHATGLGNWTEERFIYAIRHGKYKGMENSRPLMPPMPWQAYSKMTDKELKAVFAYLKTIKPVNNVVPAYIPPAAMAKK